MTANAPEEENAPGPIASPRARLGTAVFGAVVLVMSVLITRAITHKPDQPGMPEPTWRVFKSGVGQFSIDMPGDPFVQERTVHSRTVTTCSVDLPRRAYAVSFWDLPSGTHVTDMQKALEGARDHAAAGEGPVSNSHNVTSGIWPSIEFDLITPKYKSRQRIIIVKERYYQLMVSDEGAVPEADAERLFDSFQTSHG